ncbi:hypothetical protein EBZ70_12830, partial [bacterium]|nr:hypothetical protein [bacterium]
MQGLGVHGGGNGGYGAVFGTDGLAGRGGGGGGGPSTTASINNGLGGSGVVIVRYATAGGFSVTEDVASNLLFPGTPFADGDSATLTVTLTVSDGTITGNSGAGVVIGGTATARTFTGTIANLNTYFTTAGKITYLGAANNTADRTLTTTVTDDGGGTASTTSPISFTAVNDAPTLVTPTSISYQDTSAADIFTTQSGSLVGADLDTTTLAYGISGGTTGSGIVTKVGTYGTLVLTTATGSYTFTPNATAINALSSEGSEAYTVTVSDGTELVSAELMVSIAGVKEDSTITVTGLTSFTYSGASQGPDTSDKTGSTGAVTYVYAGPGYGPTNTKPTVVGSYTVTAGLASDANFIGATSAPTAFTITKATQTITDLAGADSKTYGAVDYTLSVNQGASTSALTFTSSDTTVA